MRHRHLSRNVPAHLENVDVYIMLQTNFSPNCYSLDMIPACRWPRQPLTSPGKQTKAVIRKGKPPLVPRLKLHFILFRRTIEHGKRLEPFKTRKEDADYCTF